MTLDSCTRPISSLLCVVDGCKDSIAVFKMLPKRRRQSSIRFAFAGVIIAVISYVHLEHLLPPAKELIQLQHRELTSTMRLQHPTGDYTALMMHEEGEWQHQYRISSNNTSLKHFIENQTFNTSVLRQTYLPQESPR